MKTIYKEMEVEQNPHTGTMIGNGTSEVAKRSELGTKIEIDAKNAIIRSLQEEKKEMVCKIRELADKVDLHQDELTDMKELFITVNKENDIKAIKVKKLEATVEALRSPLVNRDVNTQMDAFGELVDEIEKDVSDENENRNIVSNNEELMKLKEDETQESCISNEQQTNLDQLQQSYDKSMADNLVLSGYLTQVKKDLKKEKLKNAAAEKYTQKILKLEKELKREKLKSLKMKDHVNVISKLKKELKNEEVRRQNLEEVLVNVRNEADTYKRDSDLTKEDNRRCHRMIIELTNDLKEKVNEYDTFKEIEKRWANNLKNKIKECEKKIAENKKIVKERVDDVSTEKDIKPAAKKSMLGKRKVLEEPNTQYVNKKNNGKSKPEDKSPNLKKVAVSTGGKVDKKNPALAVANSMLKHEATKCKRSKVGGVIEKCPNSFVKKPKSVKTKSVVKLMDQTFAGKSKIKSKPEVKLPKVGKVPIKQVRVNLCKKDSVLEASKRLATREVKNGKETMDGKTKHTKVKAAFIAKKVVKESALLAPSKGKGSKISAINEDGDHESEAEKELRKGQVGRKPSAAARKVPMIVKK